MSHSNLKTGWMAVLVKDDLQQTVPTVFFLFSLSALSTSVHQWLVQLARSHHLAKHFADCGGPGNEEWRGGAAVNNIKWTWESPPPLPHRLHRYWESIPLIMKTYSWCILCSGEQIISTGCQTERSSFVTPGWIWPLAAVYWRFHWKKKGQGLRDRTVEMP